MSIIKDIIENKLKKGEDVLIMAVGDSITWGMNHCSAEETFCAELAKMFANKYPDVSVLRYDGKAGGEYKPIKYYEGPIYVSSAGKQKITIVRSGVGGNTVRRAINRSGDYIGTFMTGETPDIFLLMFGINDALSEDKNKYVIPDIFYSDLKELYNLLKENNPDAEIVFMTPTYNDRGLENKSRLDSYSDKMKQLAKETGSFLVDTHKLWMDHCVVNSENYGQRDWLSDVEGDSCHFSPKGSIETAKFIFNSIMGE